MRLCGKQVNLKATYSNLTSCVRDVLTYFTNHMERGSDSTTQPSHTALINEITQHLVQGTAMKPQKYGQIDLCYIII